MLTKGYRILGKGKLPLSALLPVQIWVASDRHSGSDFATMHPFVPGRHVQDQKKLTLMQSGKPQASSLINFACVQP